MLPVLCFFVKKTSGRHSLPLRFNHILACCVKTSVEVDPLYTFATDYTSRLPFTPAKLTKWLWYFEFCPFNNNLTFEQAFVLLYMDPKRSARN